MARKPALNGPTPSPISPELSTRPLGPLSVLADKEKLKQREEDVTKINNMNPSDLKNACDDALKRVRSSLLSSRSLGGVTETYLSVLSSSPTPNYFGQITSIRT